MSIKQMLTELDNSTSCPVRTACFVGFLGFIAGAAYDTLHAGAFNYAAYSAALWPILGAIGAAIAGKAFVETKNATAN